MLDLQQTSRGYRPTHLLQTSDTLMRVTLAGTKSSTAVVHASPRMGATIVQYTAELEAGGVLGPAQGQRFLYVLEGVVSVRNGSKNQHLLPGGYAHLPEAGGHVVTASEWSRATVVEKNPVVGIPARPTFFGHEKFTVDQPLLGDEDLRVRPLFPDSESCDYLASLLTYQPGAALPRVEIHPTERTLLILEGGGICRLADSWYLVTAGDFIWISPFCPQWFGAFGKTPTKYLTVSVRDSNW